MMERRGLLVQAALVLLFCGLRQGAAIPLGGPLSTTTDINLHSTGTNIKSFRSLASADDSQCVLTGGTISDGDCLTADDGCCDFFPECRDDGTCQLPPPVCTTDSTCDDAEDLCVDGLACVSPNDVEITSYESRSSPYLGVVQYDSRELFLVGTGDISSGSYVVNEVVTFYEEVGDNVHVIVDELGRPMSAFVEGRENEVFSYVYDDSGNLVSVVEADGDNRRALEALSGPTSVLQDGARRELFPIVLGAVLAAIAIIIRIIIPFIPVPPTPPPPTPTPPTPTPGPDDDMWGDPHMRGLRGQTINWSGVDGGWYSLIKDDNADLNVNVRVTAPLPDEFPNRQLMTSLAVLSEGHSLVIEVANPYTTHTDGCPEGVLPCLANGGLRIIADGQEVDELLRFSREMPVADGAMTVSASNLPVECRQFGGHKIWARMHQEMLDGRRELLGGESLEEWILRYDHAMAAPDWCNKYIAENDLADLQSIHAIFKIQTSTATVRLNTGVNYQGDGDVDGDGRVLPDLEFWQMDVGMRGLDLDNPALSGLLGETARPVYDGNGQAVMKGFRAFRGSVEDYRVSGALGVHFPLLDEK